MVPGRVSNVDYGQWNVFHRSTDTEICGVKKLLSA